MHVPEYPNIGVHEKDDRVACQGSGSIVVGPGPAFFARPFAVMSLDRLFDCPLTEET